MQTEDFLLELGCEELPPKLLQKLSNALKSNLIDELKTLKLTHSAVQAFATPRRLAVLVSGLQLKQDDQSIQRKGPALSAPAPAIAGFAKSCGVKQEVLETKIFNDTPYYFFTQESIGLFAKSLLEGAVNVAIKNIPIAKPMRWGASNFHFVRPVHHLIMLLGSEVVKANIMGLCSGRITKGLRFTGKQAFAIAHAKDYQKTVFEQARIEVDFDIRKSIIRSQVEKIAQENNANAVIDEALLDEVCALVEYPKAFAGEFEAKFLNVPEEALISAMKAHQKYFHMLDKNGKLLPMFISVANIESSDLSLIIKGNERVIRPRLADSEFFWEQDKSVSLFERLEKLDNVLFMKSLGSLKDKANRIADLSAYIASKIGANEADAKRAGLLCKSDLVTNMVGEFADLQGIMGGYYALNDGENKTIALAIREHYHPRFASDTLPSTPEGLSVAIADKIDSIVGIYGVGNKPTGSKDPYALKRAGLGLLRMIVEKKINLNLLNLLEYSAKSYGFNQATTLEIYHFITSRLEAYYQEKSIDKRILKSVLSLENSKNSSVYDWHLRIEALAIFIQNDHAQSLVEANKRIKNILKDTSVGVFSAKQPSEFDEKLHLATQSAFEVLTQNSNNYPVIIQEFLHLKPAIDEFFDNVMVNDKNPKIKAHRIALIANVRDLFLCVADIAFLSK
jgi:glycyl-tRNA synthetase beta chain